MNKMNHIHPLIYITAITLISIISTLYVKKYAQNKNSISSFRYSFIVFIGYALIFYLLVKLFSSHYHKKYDRMWGILGFILWALYAVIMQDDKVSKYELIGYILTVLGMMIIYLEQ